MTRNLSKWNVKKTRKYYDIVAKPRGQRMNDRRRCCEHII